MPGAPGTYFAKPERLDEHELKQQLQELSGHPLLGTLLETVGGLLAIVNEHRQILAINETLLGFLGLDSAEKLLGLRLGEALQCPHASEMDAGCGTSKFCSTCGAAIAQTVALHDHREAERFCALETVQNSVTTPLFLRVRATPLGLEGRHLILVFIDDITRQQQSAFAERAFFHDLNNTLTSLFYASLTLAHEATGSQVAGASEVFQLTERVVRELELQRQLTSNASVDNLRPLPKATPLDAIINDWRSLITHHPASSGKRTAITSPQCAITVTTDTTLLLRVLGNMAINALEATPPGGEIRMQVGVTPERVSFEVWNETAIPPANARRVFQRNFSTKGSLGRGLGTFSMKLIGEQLLGGRVEFASSVVEGTTFRFTLPN
jgi:signal transduction histidine kinase